MPARGYDFYLLVFNSISHERVQRTSEISSSTREDKIHTHKRACNILFIMINTSEIPNHFTLIFSIVLK